MMVLKVFLSGNVYGAPRPVYVFFVLFAGLFLLPLSAKAERTYLDSLLLSAHEKRLSEQRYWDVLVHYKPHGSGRKSLVDDPRFFLAPDGKENPAGELDATLEAFFRAEQPEEEHPRCRFVARYAWLKQTLDIDESRLPPIACSEFEDAIARVKPNSAVLVFPTTLNNSPASMFGHTLIRIDSEKQNPLLSFAVTYGANATDSNGFLYAYKGMFGHYRGYFSILPYYDKVSEYSDIEHRDIWEYQLNLTREEVLRMVMHVWEVRDIYSDYYFFDENCSFDLLLLLEAARPSLRLSDAFWDRRFHFWVIPVDTIRIIRDGGLVIKESYRPSQAKRIAAIATGMDKESRKTALATAQGKSTGQAILDLPIEPQKKIKILDLTAELLQYYSARKQIAKEDYLKLFLPALKARSTLGLQTPDAYVIAPPSKPENGHLPGKFSFGAGYRTDSFFAEVGWRAAYHDLLDPDDGYTTGAQINFFSASGRYSFKEESLRLWQLHLIDIVSFSPRDSFFKPVSWKVNTGFDRKLMSDGYDHLIYRVNPGGGLAYNNLIGLTYIMAESDMNVGGVFKENYSLGFGGSAGVIKTIADCWKVHVSGTALFYKAGEDSRTIKASLMQSFMITSNNSITVSLFREKTSDQYRTDASLNWNMFL